MNHRQSEVELRNLRHQVDRVEVSDVVDATVKPLP
jgi:hypothetical protein